MAFIDTLITLLFSPLYTYACRSGIVAKETGLDNDGEEPYTGAVKALLGALLLSLSLCRGALAQETRLEKVEIRDDGVAIQTSRPVRYEKTRLTAPDRIIFQLPGVRCLGCPKQWPGKGRWLQSVRAGQFLENPPVTRVVLDITGPAPILDKVAGNELIVQLGDAPAPAKPAPAPVAAPAPVPPRHERSLLEDIQFWFAYGGLVFAGLTLCLALYRIRWMRSNTAVVRAYGEREAHRVEKKLDEELQMLRRRVSAIEAKLAQLQEEPRAAGAADVEGIKELRVLLRSLSEADLLPKS